MARTLTAATKAAMMAQQTGRLVLVICTISHDDLATPFRIVNNPEDIKSRGDTYTACGFEAELPEDKEEGFGRSGLVIDNTNQWLTPTLRNLTGVMTFDIELVSESNLAASPPELDNVEAAFRGQVLQEITYDARLVRATLEYYQFLSTQNPGVISFTPGDFPALFGGGNGE